MAAPSYTDSLRGHGSPTSPPYSSSATDGERTLDPRASLPSPPTDLPDVCMFQSQRIKLDLGARIWPIDMPCYGRINVVQGTVHVTTLKHVERITVSVEGIVNASFMERGALAEYIETTLFQQTVTLYTSGAGSHNSTASYPFAVTLPVTCDKSTHPLPPSFAFQLPGMSAEVLYRVRIDMSRSGLHRHESLVAPILYLPRSYTPQTSRDILLFDEQSSSRVQDPGMKEFHLKSKASSKNTSKSKPIPSAFVQSKIALPFPLIAASGDRIPFTITISSESPALAALYTDITLQLVKLTKIKAYKKSLAKETIISSGEVYSSKQRGDGMQVLRGELGNGTPGAGASWLAAGVIEIKHVIRLSIKPPIASAAALSANLPTFESIIAVEIMTHRNSTNDEESFPALGLIGLTH